MASPFIQGLDGDLYVQENTRENWAHLDCVSLSDVPFPLGDYTNVYCPDNARKGQVKVIGQIQGDAGSGTTTITRPLQTTVNWLFENRCAFNALITWACDGSREIPENFEVAAVLFDVRPTQPTLSTPVVTSRGEDERINTALEVSYTAVYLVYKTIVNTIAMTNTAAANGVAFLPKQCDTKCATGRGACEYGYMGLDGTLYDSEVKKTWNGTSWYQSTVDPFEEGGDAGPIVIFPTIDGHRAIVARISASGWMPAEIAYTEDWGETWTNVDVGTVVGQTINAMIQYGGYVYIACSGGYIYVSKDMGDSWSILSSGVTTEDLNGIVMYSSSVGYAVGDNNAFLYTLNGEDWYERTGPAVGVDLLSVTVNDDGVVFVGAADGNLYRSEDGGANWLDQDGATGEWLSLGAGSIDWIGFDSDARYFGWLIYNDADGLGHIYRSINGGATWRRPAGQTGAWNSGLNAGFVCDTNSFYFVGEVHGGTTLVGQVEPS